MGLVSSKDKSKKTASSGNFNDLNPGFLNPSELQFFKDTYFVNSRNANPVKLASCFTREFSPYIICIFRTILQEKVDKSTNYRQPQNLLNLISSLIHLSSKECFDLLSSAFIPNISFETLDTDNPHPELDLGVYHVFSFLQLCLMFKHSPDLPIFLSRYECPILGELLTNPSTEMSNFSDSSLTTPYLFPTLLRAFHSFMSTIKKVSGGRYYSTKDVFEYFLSVKFPSIANLVSDCFRGLIFSDLLRRQPSLPPNEEQERVIRSSFGFRGGLSVETSKILRDEHFTLISCHSRLLQAHKPTLLFASWRDGTSFVNMVKQITNYPACTVLAVRTKKGQVLAAMSSAAWKENGHHFFGDIGDATAICCIEPQFEMMKATGRVPKLQYLNLRNKFYPYGIGLGGDPSDCRVFVDKDLMHGNYRMTDQGFEVGQILLERDFENELDVASRTQRCHRAGDVSSWDEESSVSIEEACWWGKLAKPEESFQSEFQVQGLEIWGFGGAEALEKQKYALSRDDAIRTERRQVDKSRFADNAFDREMLLGGTFKTNEERRVTEDTFALERCTLDGCGGGK
eukprot:GDKJ01015929.1.p1 GENE.GDKJ01015929.1~~GDKJ01015929.1.p1  ORF type:complete len:570 (-),score=107.60 GDKJ01015929.1:60-1769(-)